MNIEDQQPDEDRETSRELLRANPRPAAVWGAVLLVLVALEAGRFAGWVISAGETLGLILDGLTDAPGWVGDNIGGSVADLVAWAGLPAGGIENAVSVVVVVLVAFLLLAIPAGAIRRRLPASPAEAVQPDLAVNIRDAVDRVLVTVGLGIIVVLIAFTPAGSAVDAVIGAARSALDSATSLPSITGRETIPNQGHQTPAGGWEGTFLGLSPGQAWAVRVAVVYAYAVALLYWLWRGYLTYREHYREADWAPIDDSIDRFRGHPWGQFGLVVVIAFLIMALWAPAIGPATAEENLYEPYQNDFQYLDESGEVQEIPHGTANIASRSNGANNVGPLSYDDFDRWAPAGTNADGKDMMTFLAYGARTSLVVGLVTIILSATFALTLALLSSYYKGLIDLAAVLGSDTVQSIPALLLILMLMVTMREIDNPIADLYDGGILLALILAFTYWPGLWRSIRGPTLQISEAEWIDAARSYGQKPSVIMRKHMAPYVLAYMLIYASLILGTIIITTAALSFLGVGISPPTPEWGRMIDDGRGFVSTSSWHVATIPGVMIVFVVIGFNALGDAIRDAIDVEADVEGEGQAGGGAA